MPLRFVLDEHVRGPLWKAIQNFNRKTMNVLDVVRVGDRTDLPLGIKDGDLLLWSEREDRIVITRDKKTMPNHLTVHLQSGCHSPGVFMIRRGSNIPAIIVILELVAYAGDPANYRDAIIYIP